MKNIFNMGHISAGFTAIVIGYTSSVVIIIQAATAAGGNQAQIISWLFALGIAMGISSIALSWYYKMPILTAWSTPGAALLISVLGDYSLSVTIGAFLCSSLLITITGCIPLISKMLERIPAQLATAMLAAIVMPFCIKAFVPITTQPVITLGMLIAFLFTKQFMPRFSMLVLLVIGLGYSGANGAFTGGDLSMDLSKPIWFTPEFDIKAIISISLPLYLITMLSQNLPGLAMLKSYQYQPPTRSIFITTGIINSLFACFGALSVNLAAISAAICMNEQVDKSPSQRYRAVIWAGIFYLISGLWAAAVVKLFLLLPPSISQILAGLALLGTLLMCLQTAFTASKYNDAAILTFLIGLSDISLFGISATLWGLLIGLIYLAILKR